MARPGILRADTLELQDHDAPSAKTHGRASHLNQQPEDAWGSGRSSHEGSELLEEDADFLTNGGTVPMDLRGDRDVQGSAINRSSEDSDLTDTDADDSADDDIVDKISSSPSIAEDEEIDFEFVYALHTFVATVEGQANATKGDTMVLLDDSNSYWWLVRVVKDSSIGYLPAEHIETPTERLARLNKHRNTEASDASNTAGAPILTGRKLAHPSLSDSSEKTKNPLKKAMRRRNAKMVTFTQPTYYEASEVEWSDEEDQDGGEGDADLSDATESQQHIDEGASGSANNEAASKTAAANAAAVAAAAPAALHVSHKDPASGEQNGEIHEKQLTIDTEQANRESADGRSTPSVTKNGNIRNTDSFFKDDTAEPKKMSLTPTLLREAEGATAESPRTSESHTEPSPIQDTFDQLDKATSPTSDKFKDERKRKEKKPGMLSGLFKRKEKKIKVDEAAGGTVRSSKDGEALFGSPTSSPNESSTPTPRDRSPQATRKTSGNKLVKSPPASAVNGAAALASGISSPPNGAAKPAPLSPSASAPANSPRSQTENDSGRALGAPSTDAEKLQGLRATTTSGSPTEKKEGGLLSPLSNLLPQSDQPKKEKLKKAKQRIDLDVDSSPERESISPIAGTRSATFTPPPRPTISTAHDEPFGDGMVSPVEAHRPSFDAAAHERSDSPVSRSPTPTESASTVQTPQTESEPEPKSSTAASSTVPEHRPTFSLESSNSSDAHWDDNALRGYLDSRAHDDVRDLLIRVHDRSEVVPLAFDHPTMLEFGYHETQKQLDAMSAQLDGLLQGYLARAATRKSMKRTVKPSTE